MYAKLEKCFFSQTSILFLGYTISPNGIAIDPSKLDSVTSWPTPVNRKQLASFLSFTGFCREFISGFSTIAAPLHALNSGSGDFVWSAECDLAFNKLKHAFVTSPVLAHANPDLQYIVEFDASDYALGCIVSQHTGPNNLLRPIAFYSRKFTPAELNYDAGNKELLAFIVAFTQWRYLLLGPKHVVEVRTDHKNLLQFRNSLILNRRQARWSQFLDEFNFVIKHQPGKLNGKADALSRRADYMDLPRKPVKPILPREIFINALMSLPLNPALTEDNFRLYQSEDHYITQNKEKLHPVNSVWHFNNMIYVPYPLCPAVMSSRHDPATAGHFGVKKTVELIKQDYWWPGMRDDVTKFIKSCDTCNRCKAPTHAPQGLLNPLHIPSRPWTHISMDFITDLPVCNGFDSVLTIVDRFSKMAHFIPCLKSTTAKDLAELFLARIYSIHGLPTDIVSDQGPQFVANFWQALLSRLGIHSSLSTAYHPQSNGQSEALNKILEQYLRCYCNYQQDNWVSLLPTAEFAYNNSSNTATNSSPFFVNYGYHPRFDLNFRETKSPAANTFADSLANLWESVNRNLHMAQEKVKSSADKNRVKPPQFKIGDLVWLLKTNIPTIRPIKKLDHRRVGPYSIIGIIGNSAYKLKLPVETKMHNVFHVSLLEPYTKSPFPGRNLSPPPPVNINNEVEYEVDEILDSRIKYKKLQYFVNWKGYSVDERTWEPASHLANSPNLVANFHAKYPNKPRK